MHPSEQKRRQKQENRRKKYAEQMQMTLEDLESLGDAANITYQQIWHDLRLGDPSPSISRDQLIEIILESDRVINHAKERLTPNALMALQNKSHDVRIRETIQKYLRDFIFTERSYE